VHLGGKKGTVAVFRSPDDGRVGDSDGVSLGSCSLSV
jgi:hypothetical protein